MFSPHRPGLVNYSVPLDLTKYLRNETDYLPWHRVISSVTDLANMLEDDTNLYPQFQVMKQKKAISAWDHWIWQFRICNSNNIEVQMIFGVAELSVFTFCYCTLKKSAENCLVLISELPRFSIQGYALGGKKLCLIILIIHHHKPQCRHLLVKAVLHPIKKYV